jgi:hypothetical protein
MRTVIQLPCRVEIESTSMVKIPPIPSKKSDQFQDRVIENVLARAVP